MRIEARQRDSHRPEGHSTNLELDVDHRRLSMCAWNDAAERHAVATMPPCRWAVWPMQAERDGEVLIETSQVLVARVKASISCHAPRPSRTRIGSTRLRARPAGSRGVGTYRGGSNGLSCSALGWARGGAPPKTARGEGGGRWMAGAAEERSAPPPARADAGLSKRASRAARTASAA